MARFVVAMDGFVPGAHLADADAGSSREPATAFLERGVAAAAAGQLRGVGGGSFQAAVQGTQQLEGQGDKI